MALLQRTRPVSAATPAAAVATSVPGAGSTPPAPPPPPAAAALAAAALASHKAAPAAGGRFSRAGHLPVLQQSSSDARPDLDQEQVLGLRVLIGGVSVEVPLGKSAAPALPAASVTASRGVDSNGVSFDVDEDVEMALQTPLASASADQLTRLPHSVLWASAADEDNDEDDSEELAPRTPPAAAKAIDSDSAEVSMGHGPNTRGGWKEVLPRRGPWHPASPALTLATRPIPAWLHGRCCRCLAPGHRAAVCRDPLRCSRCLQNGHLARGCRNPWRPLSSLACLVMPRLGIVHRQAPASCEGPMKSALPSEALRRGSWASVVSGTAGSATPSDVEPQSTLADQSKMLQGLMARVGSFLERAEAALTKLSLVPAMLPTALTPRPLVVSGVGSVGDEGTELFGCFSPRIGVGSSPVSALPLVSATAEGEAIAGVVTPVLQIMPELQQLCVRPASPLSVEHMEVDAPATSCEGHDSPLSCEQLEAPESIVSVVPVADEVMAVSMLAPDPSAPSQPLASVDHGGSNVAVTDSHVAVRQEESVRDKVDAILFQIEIHSLLKRLERVSPGSGKTIVEEAFRSKAKKSGTAGKAPAAA